MKTAFVALRTLFFAGCFVSLWTWLALSVRVYDRRYGLALPSVTLWPGLTLMAAGAALVASCLLAFIVRGQGTPAPFDPPEVFVAVGPYKYVRNPMYLGAWLLLAGGALYMGSGSMLVFSMLWILVVHILVVPREEQGLATEIRAHLRRLLPRGSQLDASLISLYDVPAMTHFNLPNRKGNFPFSDAVLVNDTLYLSGRLGLDPATGKIPADPDQEARLILDSIRKVLELAGMTTKNLVFVQVFCSDVSLFERFNVVYRTYFEEPYPARAFLGSGPLLFGAHFEIQCIAAKRD